MKKNITINLFGTLYYIDEDACQLLERYLDSMKRYFNREGDSEIADDIEHRVAELLWEGRQRGVQAVDLQMVKDIIAKIGNPSEIDSENGEPRHEGWTQDSRSSNPHFAESQREGTGQGADHLGASGVMDSVRNHFRNRRFFRDTQDRFLGGVCSGFSYYLGISDPLLLRLIMVFLFFFTRFSVGLLYIILWVLIPEAHTAEERLLMKGREVTPESLNEELLRQTEPLSEERSSSRRTVIIATCILVALCLLLLLLFHFRILPNFLNSFGSAMHSLLHRGC